jgi:hypothetical protein
MHLRLPSGGRFAFEHSRVNTELTSPHKLQFGGL